MNPVTSLLMIKGLDAMDFKRWLFQTKYRDVSLLLLRVVVGSNFVFRYGWTKISGGPELWANIGKTMELVGITFGATFWGFMAGFAEFFCSILLVLGLVTRPASFLLTSTMFMAIVSNLSKSESPELAGIYGLIFLMFLITGAGRYSLDRTIASRE